VHLAHETLTHYFSCSGSSCAVSIKSARDTLHQNCVFAYDGICGSCCALRCVQGRNVNTLFLMLKWAQCNLNKMRAGTHHAELVFLHPVGSAGHVVHSGPSKPQNDDTLFFMLGWASTDSTKMISGHVTPNLSLCIYFDLWVT
jgi:hypothetical protein